MADQIGSISIFSDLDDDNNVVIDPSYSDCDEAVALQNLRQLDTEFNINVTPDLTGRIRGINLLFGGQTNDSSIFTLTNSTYYDHKMRRKAEVLKHKNNKLNPYDFIKTPTNINLFEYDLIFDDCLELMAKAFFSKALLLKCISENSAGDFSIFAFILICRSSFSQ